MLKDVGNESRLGMVGFLGSFLKDLGFYIDSSDIFQKFLKTCNPLSSRGAIYWWLSTGLSDKASAQLLVPELCKLLKNSKNVQQINHPLKQGGVDNRPNHMSHFSFNSNATHIIRLFHRSGNPYSFQFAGQTSIITQQKRRERKCNA